MLCPRPVRGKVSRPYVCERNLPPASFAGIFFKPTQVATLRDMKLPEAIGNIPRHGQDAGSAWHFLDDIGW
jgi:hypothetical protein